jgi:cellulase/cellobiase CelA1
MSWAHSSRFWMYVWLAAACLVLVQSALTVAFWLDSIRAVNIMSVEALILAVMAGLQATLTMRKADSSDPF